MSPAAQESAAVLREALKAARLGVENVAAQAGLCAIHVGAREHQQEWLRNEVRAVAHPVVAAIDAALASTQEAPPRAPLAVAASAEVQAQMVADHNRAGPATEDAVRALREENARLRTAIEWANGARPAPDTGEWFGDSRSGPGRYSWRSVMSRIAAAPQSTPTPAADSRKE